MGKVSVWKGFAIASLLWIPIYLVIGYLTIVLGWDQTIHPLISLPIASVIIF